MKLDYIGFDINTARAEEFGKYGEFPIFEKDLLPLFRRFMRSIDRIVLIGNSHMDVDKKKLVKIVCRLSIDHNVIEIPAPDLEDRRLANFICFYGDHNGELNLLLQSSDPVLLREFFNLFPPPFRRQIEFNDDLGRKPDETEVLNRIMENLDEKSYLISSAFEGCMFCVFAHEEIRAMMKQWL